MHQDTDILADLIADGIRPMPPEERAGVLAIVTRTALLEPTAVHFFNNPTVQPW
jgi:hypothetical protein